MKMFFFLAAALLFACSAGALWLDYGASAEQILEKNFDSQGNLTANGKELVATLNGYSEKLPSIARNALGNEKIDLHLKLANGEEKRLWIETKNARIVSAFLGQKANPTAIVFADEQTIRQIANSKEPMMELGKALEEKKIVLQKASIGTSIMETIARAMAKISAFFYKITGRIVLAKWW